MTPLLLTVVLMLGLLASAVLGPRMLRRSAPALVRWPRRAVALLVAGALVWPLALLAVGPVLAWGLSGPALVPGQAADVCQRCLAQANPYSGSIVDTAIPVALLIVLPAVVAALLVIGLAGEATVRARLSRRAAAQLLDGATPRTVLGHEVHVVRDSHPFALAFPARHGGIALSTEALDGLAGDELAAVLAHERAHLRQRHHLVMAVVGGLARWLGWVPLIAAIEAALPLYLEIAADDEARRRAGTPALVGALLKLGGARPEPAMVGALHAAGPERIRELVQPTTGAVGVLPMATATAATVVLAVASAAALLPYVLSALSGCV